MRRRRKNYRSHWEVLDIQLTLSKDLYVVLLAVKLLGAHVAGIENGIKTGTGGPVQAPFAPRSRPVQAPFTPRSH